VHIGGEKFLFTKKLEVKMNCKKTATLCIAIGLILGNYQAFAQTAEELLAKGIQLEEVKGELEKAIEVYQTIVQDFPENRTVAAKAQFHIGLCYEKLGLKQARGAYQDVINKYPDQQGEVALAKERLNRLLALQEVPYKPTFRKIRIPTELSWNVALSPDGQKLLLVYDKKLWLMPLSGNLGSDFPGKPVLLNTENVPVEWSGLSWSVDGKWIAFNDILPGDSRKKQNWNQSIYVIPSKGGNPKKVYENFRDKMVVNYRISLSPDGKDLAFSSVENNKQHIYRIAVGGGTPIKLTDVLSREPVFSPNGKMIAFVEDQLLGFDGGSLWIIPASGGPPSLVAQAVNASSPIWSPDASKIAFLDYSENKNIFIVPVSKDGKPAGEKMTIEAPTGTEDVRLLTGWSVDNKIGALMTSQQEFALYTLPEQGGQAAMVYYGTRRTSQPRWTPDGKQILFMKMGKENPVPPNHKLSIVSAEGGEERDILIGSEDRIFIMPFASGLRVSPDGKKILLAAKSWNDTVLINNYPTLQIWITTIEGDNPTQITKPKIPYTDNSPCWSPDGKSIVFIRSKLIEERFASFSETSIYTINSSGEELKLLTSELTSESERMIFSVTWSPDGTMIAYLTSKEATPDIRALHVINVSNGNSRVVGEVPAAGYNTELAWSPDSKRIAFNAREGEDVIKIISLDDGSIQDIETGLFDTSIYNLDWSPDGKRFVFVGWKSGDKEFWLMENFLPQGSTNSSSQ
jgi:Tol biopolymer transport system component